MFKNLAYEDCLKQKTAFLSIEEFGHDFEQVEVLQRKFEELQKEIATQEYRVTEVNELADKLLQDGQPEKDQITTRKDELNTAW
ncbi:unnamed protein product [Ceutorhynchus assimilis]|uniref:Spectrin alpha chain-like protein n=1 Tax=Ceutorhynchus assimilis TaxID=467358 RepID=A0A9N9MN02_9CUCU|nr:unnamed protein product [Ceutorhynchus assimilis]